MKKTTSQDYLIGLIVISLVLFGTVMVFSATYYLSQTGGESGSQYFVKQITGALIGFALMVVLSFVDYRIYNNRFVAIFSMVVSIGLLIYVFFSKGDINGAKRWVDLGFVKFQPSEIARMSIVVFAAHILTKKSQFVQSNQIREFIHGTGFFLVSVLIVCGLIFAEPNLSMTISILLMVICVLIAAGARLKTLASMLGISFLAGVVGILMESWRLKRLMIFAQPWEDAAGTGYQLMQSLYALGSGGLFGVGLGNSKQKFLYLTYGESDFILSIIGEELGFVGIAILMIVFIVLIKRCLKVATSAQDMFGMLLATGITSVIAIQVIINVAVITSSMPPTGVPLPFISAGNTSLIVFMASMGILLNISKQCVQPTDDDEDIRVDEPRYRRRR